MHDDEKSDLQALMEIIKDMQKKHGEGLMSEDEEGDMCPECGKPYSEECPECPRSEKHGMSMGMGKKPKSLTMISIGAGKKKGNPRPEEDDGY